MNHQAYADYGGRGISVCERWSDFDLFLADMGQCPDGLTLDRIDNAGNYSLENCRWATWIQQHNNKRNNRLIEYMGRTQTLAQWGRELGINYQTLKTRLNVLGWSAQEAFER